MMEILRHYDLVKSSQEFIPNRTVWVLEEAGVLLVINFQGV